MINNNEAGGRSAMIATISGLIAPHHFENMPIHSSTLRKGEMELDDDFMCAIAIINRKEEKEKMEIALSALGMD